MDMHRNNAPRSSYYLSVLKYLLKFKKWPNLKEPENINEKILHLEFFSDTSDWARLSDKYRVREYVSAKQLDHILVPLIGVYSSPNEIDFDSLPDQFVIKLNNGYGDVIIVDDKSKVDLEGIRRTMADQLKHPFGKFSGEPHYLAIPPKIIVEQLLPSPENTSSSMIDYKFWCFNGKARYCMVCYDRSISKHKCNIDLYSLPGWKALKDYMHPTFRKDRIFPKPANLDLMIGYAETLAVGFPIVRVDLYNIDGRIYFGEMTFSSNAGRMRYFTDEALKKMGNEIKL